MLKTLNRLFPNEVIVRLVCGEVVRLRSDEGPWSSEQIAGLFSFFRARYLPVKRLEIGIPKVRRPWLARKGKASDAGVLQLKA